MALVAQCAEGAYNATTGECSSIVWVEDSGGLIPPLPVADAVQISMAIAGMWIVAFIWREIGRVLRSSSKETGE